MAKKKRYSQDAFVNPNWEIFYEYQHGRDIIKPGMKIKIKKRAW